MAQQHLLPSGATAFEKAMSEGFDREDLIGPKIEDIRTAKIIDRPPSFVPWLLIEYGLGEITRFFETGTAAIDAGIPWQRKKGTRGAIITALDWIDYSDIVVRDEVVRRRAWHRVQIEMGRLPDLTREVAELLDAEYLARISMPARSYFYRGFEGYNVRAKEFSFSRWSDSIWGDSSGVRVPGGETRWSHGRTHSAELTLSAEAKAALALDYEDGDPIGWDADIPWSAPGIGWGGVTDQTALQNYLLLRLDFHMAFYRGDGSMIGARRMLNVVGFEEGVGFTGEARTDFGDGAQALVASIRVLVERKGPAGAEHRLWLQPNEIAMKNTGDDPDLLRSSSGVLAMQLGRTLREMVFVSIEA